MPAISSASSSTPKTAHSTISLGANARRAEAAMRLRCLRGFVLQLGLNEQVQGGNAAAPRRSDHLRHDAVASIFVRANEQLLLGLDALALPERLRHLAGDVLFTEEHATFLGDRHQEARILDGRRSSFDLRQIDA